MTFVTRAIQLGVCLSAIAVLSQAQDKSANTVSVPSGSQATPQSNTIQKLIKILEKYGLEEQRGLKKVYLSNRSITCNDGSQAGFYLRKSYGSKRWIIFLEGGWCCYDERSCKTRWIKMRHLMSSTEWPETRDVGGILSSHPEENPYWWNANHVFVPYCSSDSWSGTKAATDGSFSFMGAEIVAQIIRDLTPLGLDNASSLLLAGSSAGATGVMLNLDNVQHILHNDLGYKHIAVRGISDSGWFLDRTPYSPSAIAPTESVQKGIELWKARIPHNCRKEFRDEPWRCYFGYRLYPTLKAPLFVFQWLFDEAQMTADNVGAPVTKQQWDYIHKMGANLRRTFDNVTAVFAPSCISHGVLTKRDWQLVKIDDVSLSQAIHCWESSTLDHHNETDEQIQTNQPCTKSPRKLLRSGATKANGTLIEIITHEKNNTIVNGSNSFNARNRLPHKKLTNNFSEDKNRRKRRRKHKGKRKDKHKHGRMNNGKHEHRKGGRRRNLKKNNNNNQSHALLNGTRAQRSVMLSNKRKCVNGCQHRLIERCGWPQCNHSCPKLNNPFTGEEMDFIELLKSFGLNMTSVAEALGIDMQTLDNMDHDELLNLLTQH